MRTDPARLMLPRVLLVEDDDALRMMLTEMLETEYDVAAVPSVASCRRLLADGSYDALIVDRRLPDGDGLSLVRGLRVVGDPTPALILTALAQVDDIVEGLDIGANDYMTKPFHIEELRARLRALLRGYRAQSRMLAIGDWTLKPDACMVEDPTGRPIALTETQTRLLRMLAESPDRVFGREQLLREVFSQGSDVGVVDVYVSGIRQRTVRSIIDTVRGRGYRIGTPTEE